MKLFSSLLALRCLLFPPDSELIFIVPAASSGSSAVANNTVAGSNATVVLDDRVFAGIDDGNGVSHWLGLPYAQAPSGSERLKMPKMVPPYAAGIHDATQYGQSCHQTIDRINLTATSDPEDCLNVNVWAPSNLTMDIWNNNRVLPKAKVPVFVFLHGGSFLTGSNQDDPGGHLVKLSIERGQPTVYVTINYRLGGFGFLAGEHVRQAGLGNLGLWDQRMALQWVQKYISRFGGDPKSVTIWGWSAGAISIGAQMVHDADTPTSELLYHRAIMMSGSPINHAPIEARQHEYNKVVSKAGCETARDTLACLRTVPFPKLARVFQDIEHPLNHTGMSYRIYSPKLDDLFFKNKKPWDAVLDGAIARVPFIAGVCEDEGTIFMDRIEYRTMDTAEKGYDWIVTDWLAYLNESQKLELRELYPGDPASGSPFGTADQHQLYGAYKLTSAFVGDYRGHGPRRWLQSHASQPSWSYLWSRHNTLPRVGAAHGSDVWDAFGKSRAKTLAAAFINFAHTSEPGWIGGGRDRMAWPPYLRSSPQQLVILDHDETSFQKDDYRAESIAFLNDIMHNHLSQ